MEKERPTDWQQVEYEDGKEEVKRCGRQNYKWEEREETRIMEKGHYRDLDWERTEAREKI